MKILYFASARVPSEKAHPYQIMKMGEAFARNGVKTNLALAFRLQTTKKLKAVKDIWSYYGIERRFKITKLPSLDLVYFDVYTTKLQRLRFFIRQISFAFSALMYSLLRKADVYYTRDFHVALALSFFYKKRVFYESHGFSGQHLEGRLEIKMLKRAGGLIVITNRLKELYLKEGIPEERILVAPDGVDMKMFDNPASKEKARHELGIPRDEKVICYTGHLYDWKGAHVLARSIKNLSDSCVTYFVGGTDEDVPKFKEFVRKNEITNAIIVGHVPPVTVPTYLAASDVLVLPNIEKGLSKYTSPLKLFEYMASKRPIVASDLPSIREILNEENAVLVESGNPEALARGIEKALNDEEFAQKSTEKAYQGVQQYTWDKRAERILEFIEKMLSNR